jgi:hypothetical protein
VINIINNFTDNGIGPVTPPANNTGVAPLPTNERGGVRQPLGGRGIVAPPPAGFAPPSEERGGRPANKTGG